MWILDRQRCGDFFKAYLICFGSLVGLYIVIDAFSNVEEFYKVEEKTLGVFRLMGHYYLVRIPMMYDRLCGVITMMAAIFTATWVQRNNELLAMLAAGVSTYRVIVPVMICSAVVSLVSVANQELLIPLVSEEVQKTPDDDGKRGLKIFSKRDVNKSVIAGTVAFRDQQAVEPFNAVFSASFFGDMRNLDAREGRYVPETDTSSPLRGGWVIRGGKLSPKSVFLGNAILSPLDPDPWTSALSLGCNEPILKAIRDSLPPPRNHPALISGQTYFMHTNLSFSTMIRSKQWYQFADTMDLIQSLKDPSCETEHADIAVFLHSRTIRPLLSMCLLFLSLPLVLGGDGRNTFINLGRSLGTSALFYLCLFVASYLGSAGLFSPEAAAWGPLILFGTLAASRWDLIRT